MECEFMFEAVLRDGATRFHVFARRLGQVDRLGTGWWLVAYCTGTAEGERAVLAAPLDPRSSDTEIAAAVVDHARRQRLL
jgi:hypothetical protein